MNFYKKINYANVKYYRCCPCYYLLCGWQNGVKRLFILQKITYVSGTWNHIWISLYFVHSKLSRLCRVTFESKITRMEFEKLTLFLKAYGY